MSFKKSITGKYLTEDLFDNKVISVAENLTVFSTTNCSLVIPPSPPGIILSCIFSKGEAEQSASFLLCGQFG